MRQSSCYFDKSGTNAAEPASPMRIREPSECICRLTSAVSGEPSAPRAEKLAVAASQEQEFCCVRLLIAASRLRVALEALCEWANNLGGWEAPCWREAENVLAEMAGKPLLADRP
jgi:hypothetical protein